MDLPLQNARSRKAVIEAEIARLKEELRETESFIALYGKFSGPPRLPMPPAYPLGRKPSIPDAVALMIADGIPMQTSSILDRLLESGHEIGGGERAKQLTNLSSTLSRDTRFRNQRGVGWSLKPAPQIESPTPVGAGDGLDDL